jgi:hypothetical protein
MMDVDAFSSKPAGSGRRKTDKPAQGDISNAPDDHPAIREAIAGAENGEGETDRDDMMLLRAAWGSCP